MAKRAEIGLFVKTITFEGELFTGEGNGKKFLSLPWVQEQVKETLGFTPFLGTLNLKLTRRNTISRKQLASTEGFRIQPYEGYCTGLLFKACIGKQDCAVILPLVKAYPENLIEIISSVNLRKTLKLKDGDLITLTVQA
ncbi:MAG TPA: DUF120 domain-containing protein [Candidatus Nanoarchaeia archaeon]|nr:DUF120 domain-containing protein [Candidatus Nanoarchaeia archaeon]